MIPPSEEGNVEQSFFEGRCRRVVPFYLDFSFQKVSFINANGARFLFA